MGAHLAMRLFIPVTDYHSRSYLCMRLLYLFLFAAILLSEAFANRNNHLYRRLLIAGKNGSVIIQPESLIPGSTYPNEGRPETDKHIIHFQDKFYQLFHRKDTILLQESINGI